MTKAAKDRLENSDFFHEVCETVIAWDYYLHTGNKKVADEFMYKWQMAKLALKFITGETYGFSRNGETVSIVNERNDDDCIFINDAYR